MELYLMRHGRAAEGSAWESDFARPLTEDGLEEMRRAGRGLAAAGVRFDLILSSPLDRARQTAEAVGAAQPAGVAIQEIDALAPGSSFADLALVLEQARGGRILLVGHEPDMGRLAARLLGLPAGHTIPFPKGGVARIDADGIPPQSPGCLGWLLTARLAGSLAG